MAPATECGGPLKCSLPSTLSPNAPGAEDDHSSPQRTKTSVVGVSSHPVPLPSSSNSWMPPADGKCSPHRWAVPLLGRLDAERHLILGEVGLAVAYQFLSRVGRQLFFDHVAPTLSHRAAP